MRGKSLTKHPIQTHPTPAIAGRRCACLVLWAERSRGPTTAFIQSPSCTSCEHRIVNFTQPGQTWLRWLTAQCGEPPIWTIPHHTSPFTYVRTMYGYTQQVSKLAKTDIHIYARNRNINQATQWKTAVIIIPPSHLMIMTGEWCTVLDCSWLWISRQSETLKVPRSSLGSIMHTIYDGWWTMTGWTRTRQFNSSHSCSFFLRSFFLSLSPPHSWLAPLYWLGT